MIVPKVYKAISAVSAELAKMGIPKAHLNLRDQYQYRSIDDLLNRLAPLLPKHRLCVLPRVLERTSVDRLALGDGLLVHICLKVAFDIVSTADASVHTVEAFGEALDEGDKGTAKAMSSAYKTTLLQTFCIPVPDMADADARSPKLKRGHDPEPVGGWSQWVTELSETIGICMSEEALSRVQKSHRGLLLSLSREQPKLYEQIGEACALRRAQIGEGCDGSSKPYTANGEDCALSRDQPFIRQTSPGPSHSPGGEQRRRQEGSGASVAIQQKAPIGESFALQQRAPIGEECALEEERPASSQIVPKAPLRAENGREGGPGANNGKPALSRKTVKAADNQSLDREIADVGQLDASEETQLA